MANQENVLPKTCTTGTGESTSGGKVTDVIKDIVLSGSVVLEKNSRLIFLIPHVISKYLQQILASAGITGPVFFISTDIVLIFINLRKEYNP